MKLFFASFGGLVSPAHNGIIRGMRVLRNTKFFLALLALLLFVPFVFAQEKKTPEVTVTQEYFKAPEKFARRDGNKNKILDDLEGIIAPATPENRFDVIVLLNTPLDLLPSLKGRYGDFSEKYTYSSINGFATNLTKGQIIAFSKDSDVKQVEFDALVYPHLDNAQQWLKDHY